MKKKKFDCIDILFSILWNLEIKMIELYFGPGLIFIAIVYILCVINEYVRYLSVVYISLKIEPNSVRVRFLCWQYNNNNNIKVFNSLDESIFSSNYNEDV